MLILEHTALPLQLSIPEGAEVAMAEYDAGFQKVPWQSLRLKKTVAISAMS